MFVQAVRRDIFVQKPHYTVIQIENLVGDIDDPFEHESGGEKVKTSPSMSECVSLSLESKYYGQFPTLRRQ